MTQDLTKLSDAELMALAQGHLKQQQPPGAVAQQIQNDPITQGAMHPEQGFDPNSFMAPGAQRTFAGAGSTLTDMGHGAQQFFGGGPSRQQVDERRDRDVPLMATPEGFLGAGLGYAATAPAAGLAGASLPAAMVSGGLYGALRPTGEGESRALNTALGAATAGTVKYGGDKLAGALANRAADKSARVLAERSKSIPRDRLLFEANRSGYVLPPATAKPTMMTRGVESVGGKAAVGQEASTRNAEMVAANLRKQLGLHPDAPLQDRTYELIIKRGVREYDRVTQHVPRVNWTPRFERQLRQLQGEKRGGVMVGSAEKQIDDLVSKYQSMKQMSGKGAIDDIRLLREEASINFRKGENGLARAQRKATRFLEELIEDNLIQNKAPADVVARYVGARKNIAQAMSAKAATNETGEISAQSLARALKRKVPLSGEMLTAAKLATRYKQAFQDPSKFGSVGSNQLLPWVGASGGAAAGGAIGGPLGAGIGGGAGYLASQAVPPAARSLALSGPMQRSVTNRSYDITPSMLASGLRSKAGKAIPAGASMLSNALRNDEEY